MEISSLNRPLMYKLVVSYIESATGDSMTGTGFVSYPKLTEPLLFKSLGDY